MCDRWFNSFEDFLEDMGRAPSPQYSIERINNDGNYSPDNCRWATHREQMNNTSYNRKFTIHGRTQTQEEWGKESGINGTIICKRLKRGWELEDALTKPRKVFSHGKWL